MVRWYQGNIFYYFLVSKRYISVNTHFFLNLFIIKKLLLCWIYVCERYLINNSYSKNCIKDKRQISVTLRIIFKSNCLSFHPDIINNTTVTHHISIFAYHSFFMLELMVKTYTRLEESYKLWCYRYINISQIIKYRSEKAT